MAIHIGTSGFSYPDWRGFFYPENLPERDMLAHYSQQFNTVEVNSTYYRMPGSATFARMQQKVPPGFRFAVKANRQMTHEGDGASGGRLAPGWPGTDALFARFVGCGSAGGYEPTGVRAGSVPVVLPLLRGPDTLTPARADAGLPTVVEFRNREWLDEASSTCCGTAGWVSAAL